MFSYHNVYNFVLESSVSSIVFEIYIRNGGNYTIEYEDKYFMQVNGNKCTVPNNRKDVETKYDSAIKIFG